MKRKSQNKRSVFFVIMLTNAQKKLLLLHLILYLMIIENHSLTTVKLFHDHKGMMPDMIINPNENVRFILIKYMTCIN